jgi:hypothetical protein
MERHPTVGLGGRIIAEFDDDAKDLTEAEAEFVPVPAALVPPQTDHLGGGVQGPRSSSTGDAAATDLQRGPGATAPWSDPRRPG